MATNKHATIRYQALDKCFGNFHKRFFIDDLVEACNDALCNYTGISDGVKRRQVFDDILFMESENGFQVELERCRDGRRVYYRYMDKNFSINHRPISEAEAEQLQSTIYMLNRFKGLPQFDWMEEVMARFEKTFKLKGNIQNAVSFEQNYDLRGLEYFTPLFDAITNQQVLDIEYSASFNDPQHYIIHPYHLKQYNNRWFLLGLYISDEREQIMNMAIDRIEGVTPLTDLYMENINIDFDDYFYDVVGVTVPNKPIESVVLKIDNKRYKYIESKPLHLSQRVRERGDDYTVIELKLIPNYEFETMLLGFADSVNIITPVSLRERISARAKGIYEKNI